jgi:hypothetical protein
MGMRGGQTTGIDDPRRACSQVERTRGPRRVVSRTLLTGAQRETSAMQRRSAAPFHGSTSRHGDRGRSALCRIAVRDGRWPPPQAATAAPSTMTAIRASRFPIFLSRWRWPVSGAWFGGGHRPADCASERMARWSHEDPSVDRSLPAGRPNGPLQVSASWRLPWGRTKRPRSSVCERVSPPRPGARLDRGRSVPATRARASALADRSEHALSPSPDCCVSSAARPFERTRRDARIRPRAGAVCR